MPIKVGTVSIFTPYNFMVLFSSRNSRKKGTQTLRVLWYKAGISVSGNMLGRYTPYPLAVAPMLIQTVDDDVLCRVVFPRP